MRRLVLLLLLSGCIPPPHLRDRNNDGIISVALVGASNTVGRMAWAAASPAQAVPLAWDFPSVAERLTEELEAAGVVVQWNVPAEGGFYAFAPDNTSTLQGGTALTREGQAYFQPGFPTRQMFTKIEYAVAHADPPLDAIIVGSGLEIEGVALYNGAITETQFKAALTEHQDNALPGHLTPCGYDLYILRSTQVIDCNCGTGTPQCACCDPASGATCILFGGFASAAAKNVSIDRINRLVELRTTLAILTPVPLPTGDFVDMVHHGAAGVEAKVAAVVSTVLPPGPALSCTW